MRLLEQVLKSRFSDYKAICTSRGSSALYLALKAIQKERGLGEVIIPSTICPSVPFVVSLAGFVPRFCDVELATFCMSRRTIYPCLSSKTRAIIAAYLFGKSFNIQEVLNLALPLKVAVIEDVAQAVGGSWNKKWLGGFGDFTILSFAKTKIIKGKSGALLVRNPEHVRLIENFFEEMPSEPKKDDFLEMERSFRDITTGYYDLMRSECLREAIAIPYSLVERFRRLFIHRSYPSKSQADQIAQEIKGLDEGRQERSTRVRAYNQYLNDAIKRVSFNAQEVCWRLPILLDDHAQQLAVLREIRERGHLVSNHYFPTSLLFGDTTCLLAHEIGMRAINLWVDSMVDHENIRETCQLINRKVLH